MNSRTECPISINEFHQVENYFTQNFLHRRDSEHLWRRQALDICLQKLNDAQRELLLTSSLHHGAITELATRESVSVNSLYKKLGRLREKALQLYLFSKGLCCMNKRFHELMLKYFLGEINEEEFCEFEQFLEKDAALRQEYLNYTIMQTDLRSVALQERAGSASKRKFRLPAWAAAAIFILLLPVYMLFNQSASVAVISSSESAAWESRLPTILGSELEPGVLHLKTGVATLSFHSGADVMLEAPAKIEIVSTMELNALAGVISIHVRDSAEGFRVNTPNGHAIDHGTRFSVSVSHEDMLAEFEVQDGEISLHHKSGKVKHLQTGQALIMNSVALAQVADPLMEGFIQPSKSSTVLSSAGNEVTVIFCNDKKRLNPNFIMVKTAKDNYKVNRRALFAFDLAGYDLQGFDNVRLTLNLLPTGLGKAGTMPMKMLSSSYMVFLELMIAGLAVFYAGRMRLVLKMPSC